MRPTRTRDEKMKEWEIKTMRYFRDNGELVKDKKGNYVMGELFCCDEVDDGVGIITVYNRRKNYILNGKGLGKLNENGEIELIEETDKEKKTTVFEIICGVIFGITTLALIAAFIAFITTGEFGLLIVIAVILFLKGCGL